MTVIRAADVEAGTDNKEIYNVEEAIEKKSVLPNVHIFDGDVIYVPALDGQTLELQNLTRPPYYDRVFFPIR